MKSSLRSVGTIDQFTLGILREIDKQYPFHNFPAEGGVVAAETGRDSRVAGNPTAVPAFKGETA